MASLRQTNKKKFWTNEPKRTPLDPFFIGRSHGHIAHFFYFYNYSFVANCLIFIVARWSSSENKRLSITSNVYNKLTLINTEFTSITSIINILPHVCQSDTATRWQLEHYNLNIILCHLWASWRI